MAKQVMRLAVAATVVGMSLIIGGRSADAQTVATITTDAPQYLPGATVTFTGTGWGACEFQISVNLVRGPVSTFVGLFTPVNGTFSGTVTAPSPLGTYTLDGNGDQTGCVASVPFDVVDQLPTTTTTTTATTTTATTTTTPSSTGGSSAAASTASSTQVAPAGALARTGWNPVLLVAAGVAISVGLILVAGRRKALERIGK